MSRVALANGHRPAAGPPYASAQHHHYNNPPHNQQQNYANHHNQSYVNPPHRPRGPPPRVPKYTVGTGRSKDGKETETLTLGDSDDEDDGGLAAPQAGTSNGSYAHPAGYPNGYQVNGNGTGYAGAEQGRAAAGAGAKRGRNDGQGAYAQPQAGASSTKKRKTTTNDPYGGYDVPKQQIPVTDKEGHYIVSSRNTKIINDTRGRPGEYRVSRLLGMGTFGKVVKAYPVAPDGQEGKPVALKVIRAVDKYREAAKVEIKVLEAINDIDRKQGGAYRFRFNSDSQCIHLDEWFMFQKHTCLVTELLGASVFDFIKSNSFRPFSFSEIQDFARQMLDSIGCLHKSGITHTDLKPENILLVNDEAHQSVSSTGKVIKKLKSTEIRLIDFGSATFDKEYHASVVSTRHYRAPEIILNLGWSHSCDIWSIGCILVEFYTGEALFQTHENLEHLAMMQKVFGDMPADYAKRAAAAVLKDKNANQKDQRWFQTPRGGPTKLNFQSKATTSMRSAERNSIAYVNKMRKLETIILNHDDQVTAHKFLDLIKNLLMWDVKDRWTAERALESAFCQDDL